MSRSQTRLLPWLVGHTRRNSIQATADNSAVTTSVTGSPAVHSPVSIKTPISPTDAASPMKAQPGTSSSIPASTRPAISHHQPFITTTVHAAGQRRR